MSTQIADLFVKIGIKADDIKAATGRVTDALNDVKSSAGGLGGSLSGFGEKLKSSMSNAEDASKSLAIGVGAAGAAVLGLGGYALSLAGDLEMTKASFETMLGSAEASDKMIRDITDFAAKTPFTMTGLQDSAKMLLNFGIEADKIIPTMNMLGDISGGNEEKFGRLSLVFSQVASAGKMTGADLMQMIDAGFNPLKVISEQTGKSMGDLRKEMEGGKISFEMVEAAMKSVTTEGGMFFGLMEKQSQTFPGLMSTLEDTFVLSLTNIGTALMDTFNVKETLAGAIEVISNIGNSLVNFFNQVNKVGFNEALKEFFSPTGVAVIVAVGGAILASLVPAMVAWATSAYAAASASIAALSPFLLAGAAIGAVAYVIYNNWDSIVKLFNNTVKPVILSVWNILKSFFDPIIDAGKNALDQFKKLWDAITGIFKKDTGIEGIGDDFQGVLNIISGVIDTISTIFGTMFTNIVAIFKGAATVLGNIIGAVVNLLTGNFGALRQNLTGIVDAIWSTIKQLFYSGVSAALDIAAKLFGWIPGANDKINAMRDGLKNLIPQEPVTAAGKISEGIKTTQVATIAATTATTALGGAIGDVGTKAKASGQIATQAMESAGNAATKAAASVKSIISELQGNIEQGARELDFILKLEGNAAVKLEIEELENTLKRLANETTVDINSQEVFDLQIRLRDARYELEQVTKASEFQSKINESFKGLGNHAKASAEDIKSVLDKLYELKEFAPTKESAINIDFNIKVLEAQLAIKKIREESEAAFDAWISLDEKYATGISDLIVEFVAIDAAIGTGQAGLLAKIEALDKAFADGLISQEDYTEMYADLSKQLEQTGRDTNLFAQILGGVAVTVFPSLRTAINSGMEAFNSFKNVFKGAKEGKFFADDLADGLTNASNAVTALVTTFSEGGAITASTVTQLIGLIPGVGQVATGVMSVLSALGVDVEGAIQRAIDKIQELINLGKYKTDTDYFADLAERIDKINELTKGLDIRKLTTSDFADILNLRGATAQDTIDMITEAMNEYFAEYLNELAKLSPEKAAVARSSLFGAGGILGIIIEYIKRLYPSGTDGGGGTGAFSEDKIREFNKALDEVGGTLSGADLWDYMANRFGEALTRYVLGNRPLSNAFGSMVAAINEGFGGVSFTSPDTGVLSGFNQMPSGAMQVVYLNVDGRTLTETVVQGMPEYLRLNLGSGY